MGSDFWQPLIQRFVMDILNNLGKVVIPIIVGWLIERFFRKRNWLVRFICKRLILAAEQKFKKMSTEDYKLQRLTWVTSMMNRYKTIRWFMRKEDLNALIESLVFQINSAINKNLDVNEY